MYWAPNHSNFSKLERAQTLDLTTWNEASTWAFWDSEYWAESASLPLLPTVKTWVGASVWHMLSCSFYNHPSLGFAPPLFKLAEEKERRENPAPSHSCMMCL